MNRSRAWSMCWLLSWFCCVLNKQGAASTTGITTAQVWMPAVAALVGGLLTGIFGPILRDVLVPRWNEKRSDKKLQEQIEQSYFAPLSASAEKLIWRMAEIFLENRTHFLLLKTGPKNYSEYKRVSTLYRIAAMLGWIRAMHLELSALPRGGFGADSPVFTALVKVQSAMADGHGVEKRRFCSFCETSGIDISPLAEKRLASLAASFETTLYGLAGDQMRSNHRHLLNSDALHQEFICRGLLKFLSERQLVCSFDDQALRLALGDLVKCLVYREALIYREWQDAIGDAVILKDEHSTARQYRIMGFEEFERLMAAGTFNWCKSLREFIEDVDFEVLDPLDERPKHLLDLAKGVAEVLIAISDSTKGKLVKSSALDRAKQIINLKV